MEGSFERPEVGKKVVNVNEIDFGPQEEDADMEGNGPYGNKATENLRASQIEPEDCRQLVIRDLDTGDAYMIGENEPDFDYDTYEIGARRITKTINTELNARTTPKKLSWYKRMTRFLFGKSTDADSPGSAANGQEPSMQEGSPDTSDVKSPFSKLSSFKFRRELGRGAFGRVLLAESKTDGRLYALKIMNKKGMRSSDKVVSLTTTPTLTLTLTLT